jgi:glycosyltransferase involved in cell wall biosynthesis
MNIQLSIIIATYNSEKTLRATLESLLTQSFREFEVIIADGFSGDGTLAIIKEFEDKFKLHNIAFNWSSEKDAGIYDAWNKALNRVSRFGRHILSKGTGTVFLDDKPESGN